MKKLALIFPGQGSQAVGMGKSLFENFKSAREIAESANKIMGFPLTELMFHGNSNDLLLTKNAQPAILTTSAMVFAALKENWNSKFNEDSIICAAGHSVGEYSAIFSAGCLNFENTLQLLKIRAEAMNEASTLDEKGNPIGSMCAILGLDTDSIETILESEQINNQQCTIANDNCPGQIVISGAKQFVEQVSKIALEQGAKKCVMLSVSGPFHTPLMQPAADILALAVKKISFMSCKYFPVILNTTSLPATEAAEISNLLPLQIVSRVRWRETTQEIAKMKPDLILELGNGNVLKSITQRCLPEHNIISVQNAEDVKNLEL